MENMKVLATLVPSSSALVFAMPAAAQFKKPEIWKDQTKFKELAAAPKTGNIDNVKAACGVVAEIEICKSAMMHFAANNSARLAPG